VAKKKYRRFKRTEPTGEQPGPIGHGAGATSVSAEFTEAILDMVDPLGPEQPPAPRYGPLGPEPVIGSPNDDSSASHGRPAVCGASEFSHGGGMQRGVNASARRRAFEGN
jgi:hypothetical protein